MIKAPEIFARIYEKHGHRCPMSTLGGRLGLAALAQSHPGNEIVRAVYHVRTCAVDGIVLTTGCEEESGSLTVTTEGRHVLEIFDPAGNAVELSLNENAMRIAGDYRRLSLELERNWNELDDLEQAERERNREVALDSVLPLLWNATDKDLIAIRPGASIAGAHG